jgi:hypothetical protein
LTYFRDLQAPKDEHYLEKALSSMSNSKDDAGEDVKDKKDEVLSPLLVLEILKDKPNLKFKVIKKYLLNRLKIQDRVIRKHENQVDENMKKINDIKK